jgi:hypothetical protein
MSSNTTSSETNMSKSEIFAHNSKNTNGVSLVLPRVFPNWTYKMIKQKFIECGWGFVERVDVVPPGRIPKGRFKTAFIHFRAGSYNMRDSQARQVLEKLSQGPDQFIKLTYDEPWYWKVFISSAVRPDEAPKPPTRPQVSFLDEGSSAAALAAGMMSESIITPTKVSPVPALTRSDDHDLSLQPDAEMRDAI